MAAPKRKVAKSPKRRTKVVETKHPAPTVRHQGTTARPGNPERPKPVTAHAFKKREVDAPLHVPPSQQSAQGPVAKPGEPVGMFPEEVVRPEPEPQED